MPTVTGNLTVVTSAAADVKEVLVRATRVRPSGSGMVVDDEVRVATPGGRFSANLVAGPAVVLLEPDGASPRAVPILVAASPSSQSLEAVMRAAELSKGTTRDALEELAAAVGAEVTKAQSAATRAESAAKILGAVNTVTVETEAQAQALNGLRKGDVVIVTETGNIYKEV